MAIGHTFGPRAQGGDDDNQLSMDELQLIVSDMAQTYAGKLGADAPKFTVERDTEGALDVMIDGASILIIVADDMTPGEFVLLKPYAFTEPPLGGGKPDPRFFQEVRALLKEGLRGQLMPGVTLDDGDEEEPPSDDGPSDDDIERFLRSIDPP